MDGTDSGFDRAFGNRCLAGSHRSVRCFRGGGDQFRLPPRTTAIPERSESGLLSLRHSRTRIRAAWCLVTAEPRALRSGARCIFPATPGAMLHTILDSPSGETLSVGTTNRTRRYRRFDSRMATPLPGVG